VRSADAIGGSRVAHEECLLPARDCDERNEHGATLMLHPRDTSRQAGGRWGRQSESSARAHTEQPRRQQHTPIIIVEHSCARVQPRPRLGAGHRRPS
jgi:hypothetical protein